MRFPTTMLASLALASVVSAPLAARQTPPSGDPIPLSVACPAAQVPFGPGEEALYLVKVGVFDAGEGRLSVEALDTIRGHETYRLRLYADASLLWASAEYDYASWLDTSTLVSRRHTRDQVELGKPRHRFYEIFPEERRWLRADTGEEGETPTACALDDLSLIYYLRSQALSPGETLTLNRYFKKDGNPVRVAVTGRDRTEVPAGTFNTVVVRPTIRTDGLFGEGGEAELHFSDDEHRHLVYMRIEMPLVGSITLHLKEVREGRPLPRPGSPARSGRGAPGSS